mgnify:CR=1 FL=1
MWVIRELREQYTRSQMTHLYSSCRSACLSATWRFRDALLHSTLPHSWQVNSFFADWVFREFKVSPVIEVSTETQQCTSCSCNPYTLKPYPPIIQKDDASCKTSLFLSFSLSLTLTLSLSVPSTTPPLVFLTFPLLLRCFLVSFPWWFLPFFLFNPATFFG